jgi:NAD(P)-dependent dehydrogenase (short-subunit alcohol dehydrogenase family)
MTDVRFDGQVAVVTGAGRNLGRAYALLLAERGAKVVVNDLGVAISDTDGSGDAPSVNPALDVVAEIKAAGGEAVASTESIAEPAGADAIVARALDTFGSVDILINNAGVVRQSPIDTMTPDLVAPVVSTHITGTINVTRAAWAVMKERGYGRLVNVSSGAGLTGIANMAVYSMVKLGVVGFTRALAVEGAAFGIKVNVIAPYASVRGNDFGPVKWSPRLADWLSPRQVAPLVAWLCHRDCPISGECFTVGGGFIGRMALAYNDGWASRPLTLEKVRDGFSEIMGTDSDFAPAPAGTTGDLAGMMEGFQ